MEKYTTNAVKILHDRYIGNNPKRLSSLRAERINAELEETKTKRGIMKTIEIVLKEIDDYPDEEVIKQKRIIFLRPEKIEELKKDTGLLGDLLRDSSK